MGQIDDASPFNTHPAHSHGHGLSKFEELQESELQKLRRENKQLVEELSHVSRTPRDEVFERHRITKAKNEVVRLQLEYNNNRHQCECRKRSLNSLKSKLLETEMLTEDRGESAGIVEEGKPSVNVQHDCVMHRVQEVEELLSNSDYTNRTYEHILKRYDKERQGMENAYVQMNSSLSRLSKATDELEISIKVTKHEEESLYIQMSGIMMDMNETRGKHDKILNNTRRRVDEQAELHKYMSDRDVHRAGIAKEAQGDLDEHGERILQDRIVQVRGKKLQSKSSRDNVKKIENNIRRTLGPDGEKGDSKILVNRLENIKYTKSDTEQKRDAAEQRKIEKEEELANLQQQLQEVQTSGVDLSYRRAVFDDIERRMTSADRKCSTFKHKYEVLVNKLLPLYAGMQALNLKLESSMAFKGGKSSKSSNIGTTAMKEVNIGDDIGQGGSGSANIASGLGGKEASSEQTGQEDSENSKYLEQLDTLDSSLSTIVESIDSISISVDSGGTMSGPTTKSNSEDVHISNNVRVPLMRPSSPNDYEYDDDEDMKALL